MIDVDLLLLEGVVFTAGQRALLAALEDDDLPGIREGVTRVDLDERWHIGLGLRHLSQIKHLPKSGTPNHPMGSLCFIIRSVSLFSPSNTGHSVLGFSLEVGGCSFPQFRMPLRVQHP